MYISANKMNVSYMINVKNIDISFLFFVYKYSFFKYIVLKYYKDNSRLKYIEISIISIDINIIK